jgi:hypothetical protein
MNRGVSRIRVALVVGVVCLSALAVRFVGKSWAAPESSNVVQSALPPDAKNVEIVNNMGGYSHEVVVMGNYAYLAIGQKLLILDVSDPENPVPVTQVI